MKTFTYIVIGVVTAAIVAGFFVIGSPREERLRRFDDRRVQDLQYIQNQIIEYWRGKEKLPENLGMLNDPTRGINIPHDPNTGVSYEYRITDASALAFELCATFDKAGRPVIGAEKTAPSVPVSQDPYLQNWGHQAGRTCFDRSIDKDFYSPIRKTD